MTLPVEPQMLAAFAVTAAAIVVSPGPDTMLILRSALTSGARTGLAAVAGVQAGLLVHTTLAALGITALIASSPPLFHAVAVAGALYLAWIGIAGFRARGALALTEQRAAGPLACARDGLLTNVLNPKVILLFLALYPNFIVLARGRPTLQLAVLSAMLIAINVVWQVGLVWAADRARRWFGTPAVQRWIGRTTGIIFLAFAAAMLWDHLLAG